MRSILAVLSLSVCLLGCGTGTTPEQAAKPATEAPATTPVSTNPENVVVIEVPGMMCPTGCAPRVRSALEGIDGVVKVETDVDKHIATVSLKDKQKFDEKKAVQAVTDAGFDDVKIVSAPPAK